MKKQVTRELLPVAWRGDSKDRLGDFPKDACLDLGRDLDRVQWGEAPLDWKPFPCSEKGVKELRTKVSEGFYRVVYWLKIKGCVVVLHAFSKSKGKTEKKDVRTINQRLAQLKKDLKSGVFYEENKRVPKKA